MRQNVLREFLIRPDFFFFLCHTDMGLINKYGIFFFCYWPIFPGIGQIRLPYLGVKNQGNRVLDHPVGISRNSITRRLFPMYPQTV